MAAEVSAPPPSKIPKLIYANFTGRAEPARLAFKIGGVTFHDERVENEKLKELSAAFPFKKMPVLEVDGLVIPESMAIARYAAKLGGLIPSDSAHEARMDSIISAWCSLFVPYENVLNVPKDQQSEATKKAVELMTPTLAQLDAYVGQNKAGYCVGDTITLADVVTACNIMFLSSRFFPLNDVPTTIADKCSNLLAVQDQVLSHPAVVKHYMDYPQGLGSSGIWRPVGGQ